MYGILHFDKTIIIYEYISKKKIHYIFNIFFQYLQKNKNLMKRYK